MFKYTDEVQKPNEVETSRGYRARKRENRIRSSRFLSSDSASSVMTWSITSSSFTAYSSDPIARRIKLIARSFHFVELASSNIRY